MDQRRFTVGKEGLKYLTYGRDCISDDLHGKGEWEPNLMKKAEDYLDDDSVILDIGANIGTWTVKLATGNRKVIAFEPFYPSYLALCGNIFMNKKEKNVVAFNMAVTNVLTQRLSMEVVDICNLGANQIRESPINKIGLMRIDDLQLLKVDFIKIDVEGHEYEALKSAEETLKRYKPVIFFECWNHPNHRDQKMRLMSYLVSLGYKITHLQLDGPDDYMAEPLL